MLLLNGVQGDQPLGGPLSYSLMQTPVADPAARFVRLLFLAVPAAGILLSLLIFIRPLRMIERQDSFRLQGADYFLRLPRQRAMIELRLMASWLLGFCIGFLRLGIGCPNSILDAVAAGAVMLAVVLFLCHVFFLLFAEIFPEVFGRRPHDGNGES